MDNSIYYMDNNILFCVICSLAIFWGGVRLKWDKERDKEQFHVYSSKPFWRNSQLLTAFSPTFINVFCTEAHGLTVSSTIKNILKRTTHFSLSHVVLHTSEYAAQRSQLLCSLAGLTTTENCQWNLQERGQGQRYYLVSFRKLDWWLMWSFRIAKLSITPLIQHLSVKLC